MGLRVLHVLAAFHICGLAVCQISQQPIQNTGENDSPFDAVFDAFVEDTIQQWHVPGLSIAVVDNGKIYSKGYGFATLDPDQNATADTQYFTGSTTKALTAAAAALLVHDNENYPNVKWTSPINDFIREDFVLEDEYSTNHLTLEDALSHRTGMPRHDLTYGQANDTLSSVVRRMRHLPMTSEPRVLWQYCNLMFAVVGDLLESITGKKLESLLEDRIWRPLGMSSTTFTIPQATNEKSRLARGYYWNGPDSDVTESQSKDHYVPDPYLDLSIIAGAGATISTVNDYALWIRALLQAAHGGNESSPISHSIFKDLVTPRAIVPFDDDDVPEIDISYFITPPYYALGWETELVLGQPLIAHNGGLTGFGTQLYILPDNGFGVVTMGNTAETSNWAGAIISSSLLLRKLGLSTVHASAIQESLLRISGGPKTSLRDDAWRRRRSSAKSWTQASQTSPHAQSLPLPRALSDFAGLYAHPAYGPLNFTLKQSQKMSTEVLEGLVYPRLWPVKIQLSHASGTAFDMKVFQPHGLGDIVSGKEIVWEEVADGDEAAVFQFGPDGETVQTVGIVIEESMLMAAEAKGPEYWREAFVWFERQ